MLLMWDNVTEIKCNIFGKVLLLKNLCFFECVYFSEYDIGMVLFVFWLRNKSSIKYVRNWGNGGDVIKNAHRYVQGGGSWKSVLRYVRTKRIAPK